MKRIKIKGAGSSKNNLIYHLNQALKFDDILFQTMPKFETLKANFCYYNIVLTNATD
jgi:hypothetical protein